MHKKLPIANKIPKWLSWETSNGMAAEIPKDIFNANFIEILKDIPKKTATETA